MLLPSCLAPLLLLALAPTLAAALAPVIETPSNWTTQGLSQIYFFMRLDTNETAPITVDIFLAYPPQADGGVMNVLMVANQSVPEGRDRNTLTVFPGSVPSAPKELRAGVGYQVFLRFYSDLAGSGNATRERRDARTDFFNVTDPLASSGTGKSAGSLSVSPSTSVAALTMLAVGLASGAALV